MGKRLLPGAIRGRKVKKVKKFTNTTPLPTHNLPCLRFSTTVVSCALVAMPLNFFTPGLVTSEMEREKESALDRDPKGKQPAALAEGTACQSCLGELDGSGPVIECASCGDMVHAFAGDEDYDPCMQWRNEVGVEVGYCLGCDDAIQQEQSAADGDDPRLLAGASASAAAEPKRRGRPPKDPAAPKKKPAAKAAKTTAQGGRKEGATAYTDGVRTCMY